MEKEKQGLQTLAANRSTQNPQEPPTVPIPSRIGAESMVPAAGQWRWPAAGGQGQAWPVSAGTDDAKYRASHWPENPNPANQTPPNDPIRSCLALGRCWGDPQFQPAASPPTAMTSAPTRHGPRISWRSRRSSPVLATCPSSDSHHTSHPPARLPPPSPLCHPIFLQPLPSLLCLPFPHHNHPPHNAMASKPETCCGKSAECVCGMSCPYMSSLSTGLSPHPLLFLQLCNPPLPLGPSEASSDPPARISKPSLHLEDCFWLNSSLTHISSPASPSPAQQATCSCGKQSALKCNCEKATTENSVEGARCSCKSRPAGQCNCARADTENKKSCGDSCDCGCRVSGESP